MRKFYPLVLLALCACMPSAIKAQGQHPSTHEWIGNSISTVVTSTNEDIKNVYLYNIGTGKYLNAGSYWGTVVVGFGVGMPINITKSPTSGKYRMQVRRSRQKVTTLPLAAEKTRQVITISSITTTFT